MCVLFISHTKHDTRICHSVMRNRKCSFKMNANCSFKMNVHPQYYLFQKVVQNEHK